MSGLATAISTGYFAAISTFLPSMVTIYGFSASDGAYLGTCFEFSGIAGGIITSIIVTKT
jgi:hypothetical protein